MKKKPFGQDSGNDLNETIKKLSRKKDAPKFVFVIIFVLYIVTSIALRFNPLREFFLQSPTFA